MPSNQVDDSMHNDTATSSNRHSESTSSQLVTSLQAGDPGAWRRFVQRYGPEVYRWCRRWPLSPDDVADVFQEVFVTVHRGISEFRRNDPASSFRGWLWTITRSRAADHLRRNRDAPSAVGGTDAQQQLAEIAEPLADDTPPPLAGLTVHAAEVLIRAEFEERTWQLFCRSVIDGRSTDLVAAEFGVTPGAVRQARYRVLKRLREELSDA